MEDTGVCFQASSPPGEPSSTHPRSAVPVGIKVRDNESIDRALRRFKRAVNRSRVLRMFRENMAFVKPSETRREVREERLRQARKYSRSR